jgi:hypothetical protein
MYDFWRGLGSEIVVTDPAAKKKKNFQTAVQADAD